MPLGLSDYGRRTANAFLGWSRGFLRGLEGEEFHKISIGIFGHLITLAGSDTLQRLRCEN
jgi:hypothetical protein